jgi:hypothetical protein
VRLLQAAVAGVLLAGAVAAVPLIAARPGAVRAAAAPTPTVALSAEAFPQLTHQPAARVLLRTNSPGDSSGLLPVQGTLGVSKRGCVTLTDRIERIVVVSADGRLSTDGLSVVIPGEGAFRIGDFIRHAGWTKRHLNNLRAELVPRAQRQCEPGPYVFLDPT